jgi:hypothetical protein
MFVDMYACMQHLVLMSITASHENILPTFSTQTELSTFQSDIDSDEDENLRPNENVIHEKLPINVPEVPAQVCQCGTLSREFIDFV